MKVDPTLAKILKELQNQSRQITVLKETLAKQNSWGSFWGNHFVDFLVIFLADVFAAAVVVYAIEARREKEKEQAQTKRDREMEEIQTKRGKEKEETQAKREKEKLERQRAERVLSKLNPHMERLLLFLRQRVNGQGSVIHSTPWGSGASQMRADFSDPVMVESSVDWQYPGGPELGKLFHKLWKTIQFTTSMSDGPRGAEILELAEKVESLRNEQSQKYLHSE